MVINKINWLITSIVIKVTGSDNNLFKIHYKTQEHDAKMNKEGMILWPLVVVYLHCQRYCLSPNAKIGRYLQASP